ncbi:MAG TPA: sigma-70 family RNA polymerase sigma factor [Flavobacteriales bacterium]|nr:sigma-70 family RNA polymerase sigma factor [Flavobacteriales bacterium]
MNNATLIAQLRSGQPNKALEELYKGYPTIRHFIKTHGGNDDDARDVFQECIMVLYRNVQKSDFTLTANVNTYLFSITKYMWKDILKKKNRQVNFVCENTPGDEEDIKAMLEEEEKFKWLDEILGTLGEKCAGILRMTYFSKMSMDEIAQALGYKNVDTAKTQKYKCLERARNLAAELNLTESNRS